MTLICDFDPDIPKIHWHIKMKSLG